MKDNRPQIFLSYCWSDTEVVNKIYTELSSYSQIDLHRDRIDINRWGSIREYMQSISEMDYTILLISDEYLKSDNCMYEVLEVMRDRKYKNKIFPAIMCEDIYKPIKRIKYVQYWQEECKKLNAEMQEIYPQNWGNLSETLKRYQNIAANIIEFLDTVADMNNPKVTDITEAVKEKLAEMELISVNKIENPVYNNTSDLFEQLGIREMSRKATFTDLEINQFMIQSFQLICDMFEKLCRLYEEQNPQYKIVTEHIDSRNCLFEFYHNGMKKTGIKIDLKDTFGNLQIGISKNLSMSDSCHSWNELYTAVNVNGQLKMKATLAMWGAKEDMDVKGVVNDIWERHIAMYLK